MTTGEVAKRLERRVERWTRIIVVVNTQPRLERIRELRHNFTPYDAAFLATAEALESEHKEPVAPLTADLKILSAPLETLLVQVLVFEG